MLRNYIDVSEQFVDYLCERAAICVQKNAVANRECQALIKKNIGALDSVIKESIFSLSSVCLLGKPSLSILNVAKTKALFLWIAQNGDDEKVVPVAVLQRVQSIIKQKMPDVFTKYEKGMNQATRCEYENGRDIFRHLNSIVDETALVSITLWIKFLLSSKAKGTIDKQRLFSLCQCIRIPMMATWSISYEQKRDFAKFLTSMAAIEKEAGIRDDIIEIIREENQKDLLFMVNREEFRQLIRRCDAKNEEGRCLNLNLYYSDTNEKDKPDKKITFYSVQSDLIRGMFGTLSDSSAYVDDLFKPGIGESDINSIAAGLQEGFQNMKPYVKVQYESDSFEDILDFDKKYDDDIFFPYIAQTVWFMKNLKRVSCDGIQSMRQLVYQTWVFQRTGQKSEIDKQTARKIDAVQRELDSTTSKVQALNTENNDLKERYFSLLRRYNHLQSEIEKRDLEKIERADEKDADKLTNELAELELSIEEENPEILDKDWVKTLHSLLQGKNVFIVGGNENLLKKISDEFPELHVIDTDRSTTIENAIAHADFVFFRYSSLSHGMYWRVRNICRASNVLYGYLRNYTALYLLAKDMCEKLNAE